MQRTLVQFVSMAFTVYYWLLIGRIIVSWMRVDPYHPVVTFIVDVTEPVLAPFRNLVPTGRMGIDFSPLIALLVLSLVRRFVIQILYTLPL